MTPRISISYRHFLVSFCRSIISPFLLDILHKKELIICKIPYINIFYFYFFYFFFLLFFSAFYYTLRMKHRIAFLFINCCFPIVIIEKRCLQVRHLFHLKQTTLYNSLCLNIIIETNIEMK